MFEKKSARYLVALSGRWSDLLPKQKKLLAQSKFLLGEHATDVDPAPNLSLKFRDQGGRICVDGDAHLHVAGGEITLYSTSWSGFVNSNKLGDRTLLIYMEQVDDVGRMWIHVDKRGVFEELAAKYPELRLEAHELPPSSSTLIHSGELVETLFKSVLTADRELVAPQTDNFLRAPSILVPLATHVAGLSSEENLRFPIQLKTLADQFRIMLHDERSALKIHKIARNHLEVWAAAQGKRYAFLDGGVARVLGIPGGEPTAMRVGVYCARAGDPSMSTREDWKLVPFVLGDVIDRKDGPQIPEGRVTDMRRLAEAARYTLEGLVALRYADRTKDLEMLFVHGPLINQFVMYDEGEPHFIPAIQAAFLNEWGIDQSQVASAMSGIPTLAGVGSLWRQFMAIYGYLTKHIFAHRIPIVGVVERSAGRWLAEAVLRNAVEAKLIKDSYRRKAMDLLKKYNISDDFLFGCVLDEGEYTTPTTIFKNSPRRAREHWQGVVGQYPQPKATVLKTSAMSFPFRIELNEVACAQSEIVMRSIYHTARLLPQYAFPVGLDIVDRFAKVPDWLSKGVSARLGAVMLERAIGFGDPRLISQLRQFLAHTPRDFFYRPQN